MHCSLLYDTYSQSILTGTASRATQQPDAWGILLPSYTLIMAAPSYKVLVYLFSGRLPSTDDEARCSLPPAMG